jgi:hypothetical protein
MRAFALTGRRRDTPVWEFDAPTRVGRRETSEFSGDGDDGDAFAAPLSGGLGPLIGSRALSIESRCSTEELHLERFE